jgi:DNA-binding GntR family transcriptional regulator
MKPSDMDAAQFEAWENAVVFRLFADQTEPTLTVPEQIAGRIGDRILNGQMAPGERIGEQDLSDEFSVSRGPIREAIRILEREGLATILPRRGAVVTELSTVELRELMEIRGGLFEIVVRKLADPPHPELVSLMRAGADRLQYLSNMEDAGDEYAETAYRLLILCARLAGNQRLQRMLTGLSLQTLRYSKLGLSSMERRQRSARLWQEATFALMEGDVERMVRLTRQRIEESGDEAIRHLQNEPAIKERT